MSRRVLISEAPFASGEEPKGWNRRGEWPARWISCEHADQPPTVAAYRLQINFPKAQTIRIHVTADERYRLFLNGEQIGSGSERGDLAHWFFETYDLEFVGGENTLVAQVWTLAEESAFAQFSLRHEFLLAPDLPELAERMATGIAPWKTKELSGYRFANPQTAWGTGFNVVVEGKSFSWEFESGKGDGWVNPIEGDIAVFPEGVNDKSPRRLLLPATLPPMANQLWSKARVRHVSFPAPGSTKSTPFRPEENLEEESMDWTRLVLGNSLTIPPNSRRRVLLDLHDYVCAYPELVVSQGKSSQIRVNWQESLFDEYGKPGKGNRDEIDDKFFCTIYEWEEGVGDTFNPDGGDHRHFTTLWWQCGRYVELLVQTQQEPLILESLQFREDRYPFENRLRFQASDERLEKVGNLAYRTLQMCSHETYMDCPYYEQLQYIGDTRLQVLTTYVTSSDDRLPRKALEMFDWSRQIDGITQSRYPSRVTQIIPPFSLWWICMIGDYALWRGHKDFVKSLMPGARIVLDWFRATIGRTGLVEAPKGWNFIDWVPGWSSGMPLGADDGASCVFNRQFEIALRTMHKLEAWLGEPEMAARHLRTAEEIADVIHRSFWSNKRGMYADDLAHSSFSEHAQVLSILTESLPSKIEQMVTRGLITEPDLHQTTVYFTHYLFEVFAKIGRIDLLLARMDLWFGHLENGMKTVIEHPEPTRSDCHAWGAHPLYHYAASIAGVRPKGYGAQTLEVRPNLGELDHFEASFPFGGSEIYVAVRDGDLEVRSPKGIRAEIHWKDATRIVEP